MAVVVVVAVVDVDVVVVVVVGVVAVVVAVVVVVVVVFVVVVWAPCTACAGRQRPAPLARADGASVVVVAGAPCLRPKPPLAAEVAAPRVWGCHQAVPRARVHLPVCSAR